MTREIRRKALAHLTRPCYNNANPEPFRGKAMTETKARAVAVCREGGKRCEQPIP